MTRIRARVLARLYRSPGGRATGPLFPTFFKFFKQIKITDATFYNANNKDVKVGDYKKQVLCYKQDK